jgi:hypothetical protein
MADVVRDLLEREFPAAQAGTPATLASLGTCRLGSRVIYDLTTNPLTPRPPPLQPARQKRTGVLGVADSAQGLIAPPGQPAATGPANMTLRPRSDERLMERTGSPNGTGSCGSR